MEIEVVQLHPNSKPRKPRSIARKPRNAPYKARKPLKRPKLAKRKKLPELRKLRAQLWELCKQLTRKTYGNVCFTCGAANLSGSNWHTAHFIARSICGLYLRYDLRNLRNCCYRCNVSLAGNGANFYRNLVETEGQAYVDGIFADKTHQTKETRQFYVDLIAQYTEAVHKLNAQG